MAAKALLLGDMAGPTLFSVIGTPPSEGWDVAGAPRQRSPPGGERELPPLRRGGKWFIVQERNPLNRVGLLFRSFLANSV